MVNQEGFSEIEKLLSLKGNFRGTKNEIVEKILSHNEQNTPGCRIHFITSKKENNSWMEYKILYKIKKYKDNADYLSYVFESMSKIMKDLKDLDMDSVGIQEVYSADPYSYYILIYMIDKNFKEIEQYEYFDE